MRIKKNIHKILKRNFLTKFNSKIDAFILDKPLVLAEKNVRLKRTNLRVKRLSLNQIAEEYCSTEYNTPTQTRSYTNDLALPHRLLNKGIFSALERKVSVRKELFTVA